MTVDANGQKIFTCVGDEVVLTDLEKGQEICRFIAVCVQAEIFYDSQ